MATKKEKAAVKRLLNGIETLRCWLDDTAYPRHSRASFEESVNITYAIFDLSDQDMADAKKED